VKSICADNAKCLTVHNAIDVKRFQNATPISRQSLGLSDDDFVLVFSGRLIAEKGILQLIRAMVKLQCIPQLKLLIIGANSYGTGQRPTLFIQQLEKESSVLHNSIIYTGFIDYASIPSYLKIADMAVLPSMWEEPFGLTVVEAMAAGLPLITTRGGGIPEICEGIAVVITHDNIVEQLSTAIFDLYKHPEKRKEMAQASLERSKLFDKDTYAKNFFDALQGLA
jgi:Glycosyltransferase